MTVETCRRLECVCESAHPRWIEARVQEGKNKLKFKLLNFVWIHTAYTNILLKTSLITPAESYK